jgi:hypothetical protein
MSSASSLDEKRDQVVTSVAEPLLLDEAEHKKLMRRVDWKCVLFLPFFLPSSSLTLLRYAQDSSLDLSHVLRRPYWCVSAPIRDPFIAGVSDPSPLSPLFPILDTDVGNISNAGVMNSESGHSLKQTTGVTAQQWAWTLQMCVFVEFSSILPPPSTLR